jgi:hypothetical protein
MTDIYSKNKKKVGNMRRKPGMIFFFIAQYNKAKIKLKMYIIITAIRAGADLHD